MWCTQGIIHYFSFIEAQMPFFSRDILFTHTSHGVFGVDGWWPRSSEVTTNGKCKTLFKQKQRTVYPKKYAHGVCFAVLCCGYTLTDFPISIRLTSLALWQSNDCPSASKATLLNMDKYFMWIHYERLHNHNKAKHNKTVGIFLGIYCTAKRRPSTDCDYILLWQCGDKMLPDFHVYNKCEFSSLNTQ